MTKKKDKIEKRKTKKIDSVSLPMQGKAEISVKKWDGTSPERFKELTGTKKDILAIDILLRTVLNSIIPGEHATSTLVQAMEDLKPQNALEGMLCSQLLSLHCLGLDYLRRSERETMRPHIDAEVNNAVKLLRLQHETIESLMKLRRNGEQKVIVQYVNVGEGGKAVVAGQMVSAGGGGGMRKNDEVIP